MDRERWRLVCHSCPFVGHFQREQGVRNYGQIDRNKVFKAFCIETPYCNRTFPFFCPYTSSSHSYPFTLISIFFSVDSVRRNK